MSALGFDISNNNGAVNVSQLRAAGGVVLGVKASEGSSFVDPDFERNFAAGVKAGMVVTPYHFGRPESSPGIAGGVKEANHFLEVIHPHLGHPLMGLPVLDYETVKDTGYAVGFCRRVMEVTGELPIIYLSKSRLPELDSIPLLSKALFWVAAYPSLGEVPLGVHVVMHQYTDHFGGRSLDASHVFVPTRMLALHPPALAHYLVVRFKGRVVAHIKYGGGRVKAFLASRKLQALLRKGVVTLTRTKGGD